MFCWGVITIGLGGVTSFASLTVVRFLLGVFEAGEDALYRPLCGFLSWWRPFQVCFPGSCTIPHSGTSRTNAQ